MKKLPMGPAERSELAGVLAKLPHFRGVSDADLEKVAHAAHLYAVDGYRNTIFKKGHLGDALYVVRKGVVDIIKPRFPSPQRPISRLGPGKAFGELAVLKHPFRTRSAIAEGYTELFVILVSDLDAIFHGKSEFKSSVQKRVSRRRSVAT